MSSLRPVVSPLDLTAMGLNSQAVLYSKFGRNADVDGVSSVEDVWSRGGLYTGFPTGAADTVSVSSSSSNDTVAGSGARTIRIFGLNAAGTRQIEDLTLNGTTPVVTTSLWTRLTFIKCLTGGSLQTNSGTITVSHTNTPANVLAEVPVGFGSSQITAFTVEAGYTGILKNLQVGASNNNGTTQEAQVVLATRVFGSSIFEYQRGITVSTVSPVVDHTEVQLVLPPLTDVVARVISTTADNLRINCRFDMLTVKGVYP
jgi:hypothetical protein